MGSPDLPRGNRTARGALLPDEARPATAQPGQKAEKAAAAAAAAEPTPDA
ncbi:hypothetical protein GTW66_20200 [Streptomyces sp. SID5473]|nr:hypothetical protein [Streptomyces sp. SID5473]